MADYGVVDTGFNKKDYDTIIEGMEDSLISKFGTDLDTSTETPEGQIIATVGTVASSLWDVAEQAYNAYLPAENTGVTLENICLLNDVTKEDATATTVSATFYGDSGTVIPAGTEITTDPDLTSGETYVFTTDSAATLVAGEITVNATRDTTGVLELDAGTVILISTPITGVDSVTNLTVADSGQDDESDAELRSRRVIAVSTPAVSTIDAIVAGIWEIETITDVIGLQNDSGSSETVNDIVMDAHSIYILTQGSESDDEKASIAAAIYARKDPGIPMMGSVSGIITNSQGFDKTMYWDNPTGVPIYIDIITSADSTTFSSEDDEAIAQAIVDYMTDGITGLGIGDDVSYFKLLTPINSIANHTVTSLYISRTASGGTATADISILGDELATFSTANISVIANY